MRSFALLSIAATLASLGVQASPLDVRANAEFDNNKRIPALNAPSQGVQNEHGPSGRRGAAAAGQLSAGSRTARKAIYWRCP